MALPASPPISLSDILTELGRYTAGQSLSGAADERTLSGVAAGAISFSDYLGKSAGGGGGGTWSIELLSLSGGNYTWGTLGANDRVYVGLAYKSTDGSAPNLTSIDIGNVSGTIEVKIQNTQAYGGGTLIAWGQPTTTSGAIHPHTTSANGETAAISVYKVTNYVSTKDTGIASGPYTEFGGTVSQTLATVAGRAAIVVGIAVGGAGNSSVTAPATSGGNHTFSYGFSDGFSSGSLYLSVLTFG